MPDNTCPNCATPHGATMTSVCLLEACVAFLVHDRGSVSNEEAAQLLESTDPDAFWRTIGRVLDDLETGKFSGAVNA